MSGTIWCPDSILPFVFEILLLVITRYCKESDAKDAVRKLHNYRIRLEKFYRTIMQD